MEQNRKFLPIGLDDFAELRKEGCYYVDKTELIRKLCESRAEATVFTRPRRFGKTLNMSMLANFFAIGADKSLFRGLEITKDTELCEKYMGKYPVIFLTLKEIDADNYDAAFERAAILIKDTAKKFIFLRDSKKLDEYDRESFAELLNTKMSEGTLCHSLKLLSELLKKHYGKKTILLIDEYDVPLSKAHAHGYYEKMLSVIRGLLGAALKTNPSLKFAVLTGCLRISKESIFTGLNNLLTLSVSDERCEEFFGFTDGQVRDLLRYYDLSDHYDELKEWYDGYRFGKARLYCPWDVLNQCDALLTNPAKKPQNHWINSSGNDAVKKIIEKADASTKRDIETLVAGGTIEKEITENLTYPEIYDNVNNLWSLLYMTGYLTSRETKEDTYDNGRKMTLAIPNREVRDVYVEQIQTWFDKIVRGDTTDLDRFYDALTDGDAATVEKLFNDYLRKTISIRDTGTRAEQQENFYHGLLLGIMSATGKMSVLSNREAGAGYADILAKSADAATGIVIEMKYARDGDFDRACADALGQIEKMRYADAFDRTDDVNVLKIRKYGIACRGKVCRVAVETKG